MNSKVASIAQYSAEPAVGPDFGRVDKGVRSAAPFAGRIDARCDDWQSVVDGQFIRLWDSLVDDASEPNPFNESWYLLPALQQFDSSSKVKLFTLWRDSLLIGIMPLASQGRYGRFPLPHFQNWLHPNAFLGCPLVRKGDELTFWRELLRLLDRLPENSLFAHFNGLAVDGALAVALNEVCLTQGRLIGEVHQQQRALLCAGLSPSAYLEAAVRGKKRKELRRQKSRLSEIGELSFRRYNGGEDLESWTDEFLALERSGWKGSNGSALDCADDTRRLFRDALRGACTQAKLERLDLRLDGRPLAMLVNFICPPAAFSFKTAFDEDFARFSPGVLLQIENLALLEQAGVEYCDSCAAEGHPMIDSLWTGRRTIGRYSLAIGGGARRAVFSALLKAEMTRGKRRKTADQTRTETGDDE